MVKTVEVKVPKDIHALRCRHLKILTDDRLMNITDDLPWRERIQIKIDFVAGMCGITKERAAQFHIDDLNKIYDHCQNIFSQGVTFKKKPQQEITIKGKDYELVNPEKIATGWHIDWDNSNIEVDPVRIACLLYIPKGSTYSAIDESGNLVNRIADRYKDFEEDFPLELLMNASAFFLQRFQRLIDRLAVTNKALTKREEIKKTFGLSGKR